MLFLELFFYYFVGAQLVLYIVFVCLEFLWTPLIFDLVLAAMVIFSLDIILI